MQPTRLDRLARSTIDLLTIVKQIADKGCLFTSHGFVVEPNNEYQYQRRR